MSAKSETIRVRISPGVRTLKAMLVVIGLVACLLLVLILGRARAPIAAQHTFIPQEFASYMCTGHVATPLCTLRVAHGVGHTAHVPPGNL